MAQFTPFSSDGPSLGANWEQLYQSAILELNRYRLPNAIVLARRAILDRAEEIIAKPPTDEHRALNAALRTLRTLEEVAARESADPDAA
ncbi:MAG: hypothetical protein WB566_16445 [Terriglobales bacterium]